ncbi:hypothetical protein MXB_3476 [Myxobolus squamalis]|nr:hypothetical protein MXB_3476 [Myxobolus squamalis]
MILYGENIRKNQDPHYFCKKSVKNKSDITTSSTCFVVVDCRRNSDIEYFVRKFGDRVLIVRIEASLHTRTLRGFKFQYLWTHVPASPPA